MSVKYKAVIYDWDGCLLRSLPLWIDAYKSVFKKVGIIVSNEQIANAIGNWDAAEILGHPNLEQANKELLEYLHLHIKDASLYPNVLDTLSAIRKKGINVFIITSSKRATAEITKAYKQVEKFIDYAIFADDVKNHKPNPESINLVLDKFKLAKDEVLMVGDSDKDVLAAHNAGIDSSWFAPAENQLVHNFDYLESLKPTSRITDHAELARVFSYTRTSPDALSS